MLNQTCSLCGVIFQNEGAICETCEAMMAGENQVSAPVSETTSQPIFESNSAQTQNPEPAFVPLNQAFQPSPPANNFQSNYQPFPPRTNNPPQFVPPPMREMPPKSVEKEYKPTIWNWITELPTFVKIGLVVLIFSVCFGVALKGFMQMDLSMDPSLANAEAQKPWFSAWFRSKPTAEEVFEKYEAVTFSKGKNLSAQSYLISGQGQILPTTPGTPIDMIVLRKTSEPAADATKTAAPTVQTPTAPVNQSKATTFPKPWDFDISFEMAMKNPDKMLLKMVMKPKEGFTQSFKSFQTVGFDGEKGWGFTKSYMNGNENFREDAQKSGVFFFNRTNDGISMAFVRSMYKTVEFVREELLYKRRVYNIKATDLNNNTVNFYFDIETGLITKITQPSGDVFILEHKSFDGGAMYPSKLVYQVNNAWISLNIEKLQPDVSLDDTIFLRTSNK